MLEPIHSVTKTVPDEVLAREAQRGAHGAFETLLLRYQQRVYRLAFRMCPKAADAEEITQETFLHAYRGMSSFHGESRFSTWLYRIAVNQALMSRRAARRRPQESLDGFESKGALSDATDELVHRKALTQRVRRALARLGDAQRVALVLLDLEELSGDQAAEVLGISAVAVRQRAHRARLRLREELGDVLSSLDRG
jgi:RNA polymerase sigma-70 factor (ECF subfamily)